MESEGLRPVAPTTHSYDLRSARLHGDAPATEAQRTMADQETEPVPQRNPNKHPERGTPEDAFLRAITGLAAHTLRGSGAHVQLYTATGGACCYSTHLGWGGIGRR